MIGQQIRQRSHLDLPRQGGIYPAVWPLTGSPLTCVLPVLPAQRLLLPSWRCYLGHLFDDSFVRLREEKLQLRQQPDSWQQQK